MPIIEAGAAHGVLVDAKSEPSDEVERRAGCSAKSSDVAGVRRDLGLHEHDVERPLARRGSQPLLRHDRLHFVEPRLADMGVNSIRSAIVGLVPKAFSGFIGFWRRAPKNQRDESRPSDPGAPTPCACLTTIPAGK